MTIKKQNTLLWLFLILLPLLSACSTTPKFIASRINPLPKRTVDSIVLDDVIPNPVPVGQKITITSAHSDPDGIRDVQFWVNGELVDIQNPPFSQNYFKVENEYIPTKPGEYTFILRAFPVNPNVLPSEKIIKVTAVADAISVSTAPLTAASEPTPTSTAVACAKDSALVSDVTVPDGSQLQPGETVVKTWRIKNTGTCDWHAAYTFKLVDGPVLGAVSPVVPPVPAGATVDISITITAPTAPGNYRSEWRLFDPQGNPFGAQFFVEFSVPQVCQNPDIQLFTAQPSTINVGQSAILQWQVSGAQQISINPNVGLPGNNTLTVSPPSTTVYTLTAADGTCVSTKAVTVTVNIPPQTVLIDFVSAANTAVWQTDSGSPITFGFDPLAQTPPQPLSAYALWRDNITLQNGTGVARVLEVNPVTAAFVQGRYSFNLAGGTQPTDVIELKFAYLSGVTASSGATYSVAFAPVGQPPIQLGAVVVNPDGTPVSQSLPLTGVPAGALGEFILQVNYGPNVNDPVAVWVTAALKR